MTGRFPPGSPRALGPVERRGLSAVTPRGLAYAIGRAVYLRSFANWTAPPRRIFEQPTEVTAVGLSGDAGQVATADASGAIRVGSAERRSEGAASVLATVPGVVGLDFDHRARWLSAFSAEEGQPTIRLFDLSAASGIRSARAAKGRRDQFRRP